MAKLIAFPKSAKITDDRSLACGVNRASAESGLFELDSRSTFIRSVWAWLMYADGYVGYSSMIELRLLMAESRVSGLGFLSGCNWRITSTSRLFNELRSDCEILTFVGQAGRDGSMGTPEEGEDSASKRACKTAESLDVNDGRNVVADDMAIGSDGVGG